MGWKRNPDLVYRDEDEDGALLFDPDADDVYGLNPTGKAIYENIDAVLSGSIDFFDALFEDLPPREELIQDTTLLLKELAGIRAIVPEDGRYPARLQIPELNIEETIPEPTIRMGSVGDTEKPKS